MPSNVSEARVHFSERQHLIDISSMVILSSNDSPLTYFFGVHFY
jgi:hypothetical protein